MTDLFYKGTSFTLGNSVYCTYMCQGQRGRGKTTYWLATAASYPIAQHINGEEENRKFIFIRRSEEQLKLVCKQGLFNGVLSVEKYRAMLQGYTVPKLYKDCIYLYHEENDQEFVHVGYYYDLNNTKGISIEDTWVTIFDEYVEPDRSKYKGGASGEDEPELLARLDETLNRNRTNYMVLLGNFDAPTNPYNEYFKVPFGAQKYTNKENGLFYEVDYSEAMKEFKENTSTGKRWRGTRYSEYSNGNVSLGKVDDMLICEKPPHAKHLYNCIICGTHVTIWVDESTNVCYVHDDYKFDKQKPILSVMTSDMQVNSYFVSYCSDFLTLFKGRYAYGKVRFNNQKSAYLFQLMIKLK